MKLEIKTYSGKLRLLVVKYLLILNIKVLPNNPLVNPKKLKESETMKVVTKTNKTLINKKELLDFFTITNLIKNINPAGISQAACPYTKNVNALKYAPVIPSILVALSSPTLKGDGSNSL